jgi:hypothetical protein
MIMARRRLLATLLGFSVGMVVGARARGEEKGMRAFRGEMLEILRRRFPDTPVSAGDEEATITLGRLSLFLGNLYAHLQEISPDRRDGAIADFVERIAQTLAQANAEKATEAWPEAQKILMPRLSSADYLKTAGTIVHRDFAPGVIISYVIDRGQQVAFVLQDMVDTWGITVDTMHDAALANLEALSKDVAIGPQSPAKGTGRHVVIATKDSYDATRLLLPGIRARLLRRSASSCMPAFPTAISSSLGHATTATTGSSSSRWPRMCSAAPIP